MAAVGNSTLRCPICGIEIDVPVSAQPFSGQRAPTMYLSFDLAQVRDHIAEHDMGSPVGVDMPLTETA
ncbi:hypothetical protein OG352_06370 [Streptomyces sp. NBC_01485]|uniref:hypothetical protein n=1 Tax=Streptomyces sp. NBC_01485 TaxID=2903884 RepID=UPI002E31F9AD|nr:hypothetical protein [Streptomyces sp. NBC_01485]